ncbi:DUF2535 family protein, partial [Bacillus subtilis]
MTDSPAGIIYNRRKTKKRIDSLLLKSLEFKRDDGIQVKVTEIPVLKEDEHYFFM